MLLNIPFTEAENYDQHTTVWDTHWNSRVFSGNLCMCDCRSIHDPRFMGTSSAGSNWSHVFLITHRGVLCQHPSCESSYAHIRNRATTLPCAFGAQSASR